MPTEMPVFDDSLAVGCQKLAENWENNLEGHNHDEYLQLSPKQKIILLAELGKALF